MYEWDERSQEPDNYTFHAQPQAKFWGEQMRQVPTVSS
jgi:hypothetical protein